MDRVIPPSVSPSFATIPDWCALSGMGRTLTYEALRRGDLVARKVGDRTLIDVERGLVWLNSLPKAQFAPLPPVR